MRIHIAGGVTSRSYQVGKSLASRLGLDFMSAPYTISFPVAYKEDTDRLTEFWNTHSDCVVNALSTPIEEMDGAIHIKLESELIAEKDTPGTFLLQLRSERELYADYLNRDDFSLCVNVTGLSVDYIVQHIIDCIVAGDKGHYMPAAILLPGEPFTPLFGDLSEYHLDTKVVFRVKRFYSSLLLEDDIAQAQLYAYHNKLLKVKEFTSETMEALPMDMYAEWGKAIGYDNRSAMLGIMLSKYCAKFALYNSDETYCKLAQNGDPYKKLVEMGFAS